MNIEDVVHGSLNIPKDIAAIIMTPQFQRLKNIKQLGFLYLCIPNAESTRFEHCIGTYWLTCKMLNGLQRNTDWLVDDYDFKNFYSVAIEIAALLHDVGHGPFSHSWEHIVDNFDHEVNAKACVDAIFESQSADFFPQMRANNNFGVELIKSLILGDMDELPLPIPSIYNFIFEIVNNKQCKVDVDKWDYLLRDRHYLKRLFNPNIDFECVFLNARAAADGSHIEYQYKDYDKIYEIFKIRYLFHKRIYHLPLSLAIDELMKRVIKRTNCTIEGVHITEINASNNMSAFLNLTDSQVLELMTHYKEVKCLKNISRLIEIDEIGSYEQNSLLIIEDSICGPGSEMPPDNCFYFYGNESQKKTINRNTTTLKNKYIFAISL